MTEASYSEALVAVRTLDDSFASLRQAEQLVRDAIRRARAAGIDPLTIDGVTPALLEALGA